MRHLSTLDAQHMKAYRLQVKERLYRFNFVRILLRFVDMLLTCLCI